MAAVPGLMSRAGGGDQGLGGNAAIVEAIAAHLALLEQDDFQTQLGRPRGDGQAARAGAENGDVGLDRLAHRVFPDLARTR